MKILNLGFILLAMVLVSCGNGSSGGEEAAEGDQPATELPAMLQRGTVKMDLSEHNLPFSLYVPDSLKGIPRVDVKGYGETEIEVGSTFHVVIAEGGDLNAFKTTLEDDLLYQHTIIEQGDDYILYKSEIKESFLDAEYHFYAVKTVDGLTFEIHDFNDEGGYAETVARYMLESINHIMPNNNPS